MAANVLLSLKTDDKGDRVALDIGSAYTRAGFCGEAAPRQIVANALFMADEAASRIWPEGIERKQQFVDLIPTNIANVDLQQLKSRLVRHLHYIFFNILLTDPKNKRIIIADPIFSPVFVKHQLARALFDSFQVQSITFIPSSLLALLTTGKDYGLVVDCGQNETSVLPIFDGRPIIPAASSAPLGGKHLSQRLVELIQQEGVLITAGQTRPAKDDPSANLTITQLQDLKSILLLALPSTEEETVDIPLEIGTILRVPSRLRHETLDILFDGDDDDRSIPTTIAESLLKCDYDVRGSVVNNIVVVGGTPMINAFVERLKTSLHQLLTSNTRYSSHLSGLANRLSFHQPAFAPNVATWTGASLTGVMKTRGLELTRELYHEEKIVPDWTLQTTTFPVDAEVY